MIMNQVPNVYKIIELFKQLYLKFIILATIKYPYLPSLFNIVIYSHYHHHSSVINPAVVIMRKFIQFFSEWLKWF